MLEGLQTSFFGIKIHVFILSIGTDRPEQTVSIDADL